MSCTPNDMTFCTIRQVTQSVTLDIFKDQNQTVEFPIVFDKNEWRLLSMIPIVAATQTYTPLPLQPGIVRLLFNISLANKNPDSTIQIYNDGLGWGTLDAGELKTWYPADGGFAQTTLPPILPAGVSVVFINSYETPGPTTGPDHAHATITMTARLVSLVDNPVSNPTAGTPVQSTQNFGGTPWPSWVVPFAIVGGVLGIVLFGGASLAKEVGLGNITSIFTKKK